MYFLEQYKKQFLNNIFSHVGENFGGPEQNEAVTKKPIEGTEALDPEKIANKARLTNEKISGAMVREYARGLGRGDDILMGESGEDTLQDSGESTAEGMDEVNDSETQESETPSLDDVRTVANRNGVSHMGEESGEGEQNEGMNTQEKQIVISNLEADRDRIKARMNEYKPGTSERIAAEKEITALQMLTNILIYGSINPPQVDSQGRAIPHSPGRNSFAGSIGEPLSGEMLKTYGQTGHEFATWIKNRGFPVYEGKPFYCGKNVGECMNEYGFQGLPNSGRNGADWAQICRKRTDQFIQIQCTPQEAPAGALISYERGTGGSEARQKSGHIEIALGNNSGYYFGQVASAPGGSNKNFDAGTYTVWMPISKTE